MTKNINVLLQWSVNYISYLLKYYVRNSNVSCSFHFHLYIGKIQVIGNGVYFILKFEYLVRRCLIRLVKLICWVLLNYNDNIMQSR